MTLKSDVIIPLFAIEWFKNWYSGVQTNFRCSGTSCFQTLLIVNFFKFHYHRRRPVTDLLIGKKILQNNEACYNSWLSRTHRLVLYVLPFQSQPLYIFMFVQLEHMIYGENQYDQHSVVQINDSGNTCQTYWMESNLHISHTTCTCSGSMPAYSMLTFLAFNLKQFLLENMWKNYCHSILLFLSKLFAKCVS